MKRLVRVAVYSVVLYMTPSLYAQGRVRSIDLPNREMFPGATNPQITADNIGQNICKDGWSTKTLRPRSSYTTALKRSQMQALRYDVPNRLPQISTRSGRRTRPNIARCIVRSGNAACYEEDHLISLELGGNPTDPMNLWPQPWFGRWNARVKDKLENRLHRMVCRGDISLVDAQRAIAADWVAAYKKYVGDTLQ